MTEEQRDGGRYDERGAYGGRLPGVTRPRPRVRSPGHRVLPGTAPLRPPGAGTATAEHPAGPYPTTTLPPTMVPTERPRRGRGMGAVVAAALIVRASSAAERASAVPTRPALRPRRQRHPPCRIEASASATAAAATNGTVSDGPAAKAMPSTVDIRVALAQGSAEGSGVVLTADGARRHEQPRRAGNANGR